MSDAIKNLERLADVTTENAVKKSIQLVRATAVDMVSTDTGELKQSIYTDLKQNGTIFTGICYTNKKYATFVEFGTGPVGERNHSGINPHVSPTYTLTPWWIHESQLPPGVGEKYKWFYVDTKEGRFYKCNGQPAKPFMYPALHDNQENIMKIIKKEQLKAMKEVIK